MPTGSGKTLVFSEVARRLGARTLVIAHRTELIDQAVAKLAAVGLDAVVEKAESRASLDDRTVVASVASLHGERLKRFPRDHFGLVIIDEAHHSPAESYRRIVEYFGTAKVLGVSATFERLDQLGYAGILEGTAYEVSLKQLIEQKYLCPIRARTLLVKIDLREVSKVAGDFHHGQLAEVIGRELKKAADAILEHVRDRRTLVFLPSIALAELFADLCRKRGIPSDFVSGNCIDRNEKVERFLTGETRLLTNCVLLSEGFDCPPCDSVVLLRPTQSEGLFRQMIGRGTTVHPGKSHLLILDFLWLSKQHNLVSPASLLGKDQTEKAVYVISESGEEVDIFDRERIDSLWGELRARSKESSQEYDPLAHVATDPWDVDALRISASDYAAPATQPQIEALTRMGIRRAQITSKYTASRIFDLLKLRRSRGLATVRQARRLRSLGIKAPWQTSFNEASALISEYYSRGGHQYARR
jgi:superfamily II DNA or RNA helicase